MLHLLLMDFVFGLLERGLHLVPVPKASIAWTSIFSPILLLAALLRCVNLSAPGKDQEAHTYGRICDCKCSLERFREFSRL
jgi:hypothetical protein